MTVPEADCLRPSRHDEPIKEKAMAEKPAAKPPAKPETVTLVARKGAMKEPAKPKAETKEPSQ
jgi:hypothetical protein